MFVRELVGRLTNQKSKENRVVFCCSGTTDMAEITVRYFGPLRDIVGKRLERVQIEDSSRPIDLLEKLSLTHGPKFRNFIYSSPKEIRDNVAFAINGDSVTYSELSRITCKSIKEFVVLPPISGGNIDFKQSCFILKH